MRISDWSSDVCSSDLASPMADGDRQGIGHVQLEQAIKVTQIQPVQPVEAFNAVTWVVISKPPEPIRTLAYGQLALAGGFFRPLPLVASHDHVLLFFYLAYTIPAMVFFLLSFPPSYSYIYPSS